VNATITNTPAAFARDAFEKAKSLHEQCQSEIAAGRFFWEGPSICPQEGDGVSEKVSSNRELRDNYAAAASLLGDHLDRLVAQETGFGGSFNDLVEAQQKDGYRPSFYEKDNPAVAVLADAYDFVAKLRGLPLTSYRPEQPVAPVTYQRVWDGNETERETKSGRIIESVVGWVYEVRVNQEYVDSFRRLADVKRAYPNAVKRGDD
jgi:hypothetical protein